MPRKKSTTKRRSSDMSEDIPLSNLGMNNNKNGSYLYTFCAVGCDFCDRQFDNRYKQMIHNAKHIIIPLLKQDLHQCIDCLFYFTSQDELSSHISMKHPKKVDNIRNKIVFEDDMISDDDCNEINDDETNILSSFMNECKVNLNNSNISINQKDQQILINNSDIIKVNSDKFNLNGYHDKSKDGNSKCTDYKVLVKPGFFRCKFCSKSFTNRYELICHSVVHMRIKTNQHWHLCCHCEKFYASRKTLERHLEMVHNVKWFQHDHPNRCLHCGAPYHCLKKHYESFHRYSCYECRIVLEDYQSLMDHATTHTDYIVCHLCNVKVNRLLAKKHMERHSELTWVCDFCQTFSQNLLSYSFKHIQKVNTFSDNDRCRQCTLKFPFLNLVEKVWNVTENSTIKFMDAKKPRGMKKVVTNEIRLKNIQNRMKMMNKMTKF